MNNGKPLAEVLSHVYVRELHRMNADLFPHPDNTSDDAHKAHLAAMHQVVSVLELFNLTIKVDGSGNVSATRTTVRVEKTPATPPPMTHAMSRSLGYTGDSCTECGSMQMTRNGSCLKCMGCGSTTGCS